MRCPWRSSARFQRISTRHSLGFVAVDGLGLPDGVQRAPPAKTTDPVTAPSDGTSTPAHGGVRLWHVPTP
ncbi:hypothetical protein ACIPJN_36875 [Streptomyces sp. NPDC086796]|uniref:hypothetical protein n=1 Tax=Streptomyces sp. NPDC086796 TaxID=3365760 RepID=UPI0038157EAA